MLNGFVIQAGDVQLPIDSVFHALVPTGYFSIKQDCSGYAGLPV